MVPTSKLALMQLPGRCDFSRLSRFQLTCIFGGSALVIWKLAGCLAAWKRKARILAQIKKRRAERDEVIKKLKTQLHTTDAKVLEKRQWITGLPARELAGKLQTEQLKPLEVLEAYQSVALLAHERTNCISLFIAEARNWCLQLEQEYKGRDDKPPMYGLPFSVKESVGVKGYDATAGMTQYLRDPLPEDSALVARLRQLGAIPFALTNVPQTLMSYNCSNPIYGLTTNPKDPKRTSGGSSGGEGALLAFRGSAFGLGTDLAGSIRVPAHFCGVPGLKPCSVRLSQLGGRKTWPGRSIINGCFGPLAVDVDTLAFFFEEVLTEEFFALDTYVAPIPFRRNLYEGDRRLVIGFYDYDGVMEAVPACRRAVAIAKEVLEKKGHQLVKFKPPNVDKLASLIGKVLLIDAGHYYYTKMQQEIVDPTIKDNMRWLAYPAVIRRAYAQFYRMLGQKKVADRLDSFATKTSDLAAALASVLQFKSQFNTEWRRLKLDAVICPPCASVAMPNGQPDNTKPAFTYTSLYNIMDYPAGVVPVTHVTAEDERATGLRYKADEHFAKLVRSFNQEGTVGLSVGVQCVAPTFNEEVCLRVMKDLEEGLKKLMG